jgi:hypothetical protein
MKTKKKQPFDSRGGVIVMSRRLISSDAYLELPAQAKVLMVLLQSHWRDEVPVAYGVREAANKIPCSLTLAVAAFKALENSGFISRESESLFNSRTGSKSREWILTWMPFRGKPPQNLWDKSDEKK